MIIFDATQEQLYLMFKNAVGASKPVGMGILHHDPNYELSLFDFANLRTARGSFHADYIEGRMVKLLVKNEVGGGTYSLFEEGDPDPEYQSFSGTYPTWSSLLESAGIKEWKKT